MTYWAEAIAAIISLICGYFLNGLLKSWVQKFVNHQEAKKTEAAKAKVEADREKFSGSVKDHRQKINDELEPKSGD